MVLRYLIGAELYHCIIVNSIYFGKWSNIGSRKSLDQHKLVQRECFINDYYTCVFHAFNRLLQCKWLVNCSEERIWDLVDIISKSGKTQSQYWPSFCWRDFGDVWAVESRMKNLKGDTSLEHKGKQITAIWAGRFRSFKVNCWYPVVGC